KWWVTETGMSSFKTTTPDVWAGTCFDRHSQGGSAYGQGEQRDFYSSARYWFNAFIGGSGIWSRLQGVTFFHSSDLTYNIPPFQGFGVHYGTGYMRKIAADYFRDNY